MKYKVCHQMKISGVRDTVCFSENADSLKDMRQALQSYAEVMMPQVVQEVGGDRRYGVYVKVTLRKQ